MPAQQASGQEALQHPLLRPGVRPATHSHLEPLVRTTEPLKEEGDAQDWRTGYCLLGHADQDQVSCEAVQQVMQQKNL